MAFSEERSSNTKENINLLNKGKSIVASEISTKRVVVKIILAIIVLTGVLFGTAGTLNWVEAWLYLIIQFSFSISLSVWLKKNNPELLRDRMIFLKKTAMYTQPIHELKKGVKLGDTFG